MSTCTQHIGSALSLIGASFQATVVHESKPATVITNATVTVVDAAAGLIDLSLTAEQQALLTPGVYSKDPDGAYEIHLRLTDAFGDALSVLRLKLQLIL